MLKDLRIQHNTVYIKHIDLIRLDRLSYINRIFKEIYSDQYINDIILGFIPKKK